MESTEPPIVVGWRERVALPDLLPGSVRAKIDTGARTCALHVDAQWPSIERGAPWVVFTLSPGRRRVVELSAPVYDEREVVDSGGHRTLRVFVRTTLRLAGVERMVEINLADRRGMRFPLLVGRTALAGAFTVDPARSFLHGRASRRPALPTLSP